MSTSKTKSIWLVVVTTALAMIAFAANSVLGRLALGGAESDALSYTTIRLVSAAIMLAIIFVFRGRSDRKLSPDWLSAFMLFGYALAFSLAYLRLETGMGALILFGVVQLTMIGWAVVSGEGLTLLAWCGVIMAFGAFVYLMSPGLEAPDMWGAGLMVFSGLCWGVYSLLGRGSGDPLARTASNFLYSIIFMGAALGTYLMVLAGSLSINVKGAVLAILSGAVTSGLGYVIWYAALKDLTAARAGIVQLSVPIIAAFGGVIFVSEPLTTRLSLSALFVLGGIALTMLPKTKTHHTN